MGVSHVNAGIIIRLGNQPTINQAQKLRSPPLHTSRMGAVNGLNTLMIKVMCIITTL